MNVKTARQDWNLNRATAAFIVVTGQLYAHQNKMEILAADRQGYAQFMLDQKDYAKNLIAFLNKEYDLENKRWINEHERTITKASLGA